MKTKNYLTFVFLILSLTSCLQNKEKKKNFNNNQVSNTQASGIKFKNLQGVIDTSFGTNGYVLHDNAAFGGDGGFDSGDRVHITSDGKILVCGISNNGSNSDLTLWKFLEDGDLDQDFGSGGIVTRHNIAGGNAGEYCRDFTINSDDSFYAVGVSSNGSNDDMFLIKYKSNGSPDYNFGISGYIYHDNAAGGSGADTPRKVLTNSLGNIFVFGTSDEGSSNNAVIWKYLSSGSRDTTFGSDGILNIHSRYGFSGTSVINDSIVLSNNKLVTIGNIYLVGTTGFITRMFSNGLVDPTFGTGGLIEISSDVGAAKSICYATNDYVLYSSYTGGGQNSKIIKILSNGNLDTSFGDGGVTYLADGISTIKCLRSDLGDLYILGNQNNYSKVWKVSEDGEIDTTFGDGGVFSFQVGSDTPYDMNFSLDGSLLISGFTNYEGENQMFMIKVD